MLYLLNYIYIYIYFLSSPCMKYSNLPSPVFYIKPGLNERNPEPPIIVYD